MVYGVLHQRTNVRRYLPLRVCHARRTGQVVSTAQETIGMIYESEVMKYDTLY